MLRDYRRPRRAATGLSRFKQARLRFFRPIQREPPRLVSVTSAVDTLLVIPACIARVNLRSRTTRLHPATVMGPGGLDVVPRRTYPAATPGCIEGRARSAYSLAVEGGDGILGVIPANDQSTTNSKSCHCTLLYHDPYDNGQKCMAQSMRRTCGVIPCFTARRVTGCQAAGQWLAGWTPSPLHLVSPEVPHRHRPRRR